jgi:endogenous inhibitor of DNA gyrase (YacG/DUF329 family)
MAERLCPKCHAAVGAAEQAAFCPFCGEKLLPADLDLSAALREADPVKKHDRLLALLEQHPDSLEVAEELLLLGRLYERGKKGMDFSVIKCYVLNVYLEPEELKPLKREALRQEIFHHPDLDLCLTLAQEPNVFLRRYLTRLSAEFIRLFLKGSTRHMHAVFGYVNESKAPKHLALPAAQMLQAMQRDQSLTGAQKSLLMCAFYDAFSREMSGETRFLDEMLLTLHLTIDAM